MNLTDLREVLDERSDTTLSDARTHLVLGNVHERIRVRTRRRRTGTVAAATLAVLAIGVGSLTLSRTPDAVPPIAGQPAPAPMRMIEGFPEYASGTRVIAAKSAQPPARSVSVTFVVPADLALRFSYRCKDGNEDRDTQTLTLNGKSVSHGRGCGGGIMTDPKTLTQNYGVRAGGQATATLTMLDPPTEEFALAVSAQVALADYQFPPRPASLEPLEAAWADADRQFVRADPANPQQPRSLTFRWDRPQQMSLFANTPGALTVQLNGARVFSSQFWDYHETGTGTELSIIAEGLGIKAGQQVTMTVTPERTTGDWAVVLEK